MEHASSIPKFQFRTNPNREKYRDRSSTIIRDHRKDLLENDFSDNETYVVSNMTTYVLEKLLAITVEKSFKVQQKLA